jgi:hypothetical protein
MRARPPYVYFVVALWVLALLPAGYYFHKQADEDRIVRDYLARNGLAGLPLSKESAVRISQQVRKDFEVDERRFKALNMANRPFLREDTAFLLRHKEGLCGEGARVLVNLLLQQGYDATRITLYDKTLNSAHTLVSVKLGKGEFLLDSINSTEATNRFLNSRDISAEDFHLLHYSDDLSARTAFAKRPAKRWDYPFFDYYWLFSYEALPYTKLLTKARWDVRLFNFDRPTRIVSTFAEKPNLLCAIGALFAAVLFMTLLQATGLLRKLHRAITSTPRRTSSSRGVA